MNCSCGIVAVLLPLLSACAGTQVSISNLVKRLSFIIAVIAFSARSALGTEVLFFDPSVRAAGMGDASTAVFWGDEPNTWSNPSLLGYQHGVHYQWSNTQLLGEDVFFKATRVTLAAWGAGIALAGRPSDRMGGVLLDYGWRDTADQVGTEHSFSEVDSWAVGINLAELMESILGLTRAQGRSLIRYGDVSLGYASKKVLANQVDVGLERASARAETHDLGALVRLTPYNSADRPGFLPGLDARLGPVLGGVRLDLSYGRSILNHGDDKLDYRENLSEPIARDTRDGFSLRLSSGFPGSIRGGLDARHVGWIARFFTPLVSWGKAWDQDRLSVPGGAAGGRSRGALVKHSGWELTLGNVFALRRGKVDNPDGDIHGDSSGWSLGLRLGDVAGFQFDRADIPVATGLERIKREGFSCFLDVVALHRELRR